MKTPKLVIAMGYIDDALISESVKYKPIPNTWKWLRYTAVAACVILVCSATFQLALSFIGNQATDIYRIGNSLVISDIAEIQGDYHGELLAENLELESAYKTSIELYFDDNGTSENCADWYSLLITASYSDYELTMYCMFDDTKSLEDWKVDTVFTSEATQTVEINGINVLVARYDVAIDYDFTYYAIFEYQNVVYDIRVKSNNADSIYTVLNDILSGTQ